VTSVFNDVSCSDIGFDAEDNEVTLISEGRERRIEKRSERECAAAIPRRGATSWKGG
jgi:phosphopantothenoylcysteine synthetase/decarboxylase